MAEIKPGDNAYQIAENPVYDAVIRKLKTTDPAHAETVFNPLFQQIIENVHAVKVSNDRKATKPVCTKVILTTAKWTGSTTPFIQTVSINGIIKKESEESLLYIMPDSSSSETVVSCEISGAEVQNNAVLFQAKVKPNSNVSFLIVNAGLATV